MYKPLMTFVCAMLLGLPLSGCVGMLTVFPAECPCEDPIVMGIDHEPLKSFQLPTKEDVLREKGKPDEIVPFPGNKEIWVYKKNLWCGPIPCFLLCVPLMLPLCDGFDQVEFQGVVATQVHTRHAASAGAVLVFPGGLAGGGDPACRFPVNSPFERLKIESNKTLSLSVSIDTPEDRQDEDFIECSEHLRVLLTSELVRVGVFKSVIPEKGKTDYSMDVTITHAHTAKGFWKSLFRGNGVVMTVRVTDLATKQLIGEIVVDRDSNIKRKFKLEDTIQQAVNQVIRNLI